MRKCFQDKVSRLLILKAQLPYLTCLIDATVPTEYLVIQEASFMK